MTNGQAASFFNILNSLHMITCNGITGLVWGLRVCHSLLICLPKVPAGPPTYLDHKRHRFLLRHLRGTLGHFLVSSSFMCPTALVAVAPLITESKHWRFFVADLFFWRRAVNVLLDRTWRRGKTPSSFSSSQFSFDILRLCLQPARAKSDVLCW